jgi:hypothetical protein
MIAASRETETTHVPPPTVAATAAQQTQRLDAANAMPSDRSGYDLQAQSTGGASNDAMGSDVKAEPVANSDPNTDDDSASDSDPDSDSDGGGLDALFPVRSELGTGDRFGALPSFTVPIKVEHRRPDAQSTERCAVDLSSLPLVIDQDRLDVSGLVRQPHSRDIHDGSDARAYAHDAATLEVLDTVEKHSLVSQNYEAIFQLRIVHIMGKGRPRTSFDFGISADCSIIRGMTRAEAAMLARQHVATNPEIEPASMLINTVRAAMSRFDSSTEGGDSNKSLTLNRLLYYLTLFLQDDILARWVPPLYPDHCELMRQGTDGT